MSLSISRGLTPRLTARPHEPAARCDHPLVSCSRDGTGADSCRHCPVDGTYSNRAALVCWVGPLLARPSGYTSGRDAPCSLAGGDCGSLEPVRYGLARLGLYPTTLRHRPAATQGPANGLAIRCSGRALAISAGARLGAI